MVACDSLFEASWNAESFEQKNLLTTVNQAVDLTGSNLKPIKRQSYLSQISMKTWGSIENLILRLTVPKFSKYPHGLKNNQPLRVKFRGID